MEMIKQFINKIPAKNRIDIYGFLATLIESGFDIQKATGEVAAALEQQADIVLLEKGSLKKSASIYRHIEAEQRNGRGIQFSLADRVPDSELMMLLAGSEGDIVLGLRAAGKMAKSSAERQAKLIKGIAYPSALLVGVIFALHWIGNNLLATFADMKDVSQWEPMGQRVYWFANNIEIWTPILALILGGIAALSVAVNKKVQGDPREAIHWIPPLNLIRSITGATYLRTLASLILAGSTIQGALLTMRDRTGSEYMRHYLHVSVSNMRAGVARQGPGKAIGSKLFSPWVMVKMDIYSRGTVDKFIEALSEIADDAEAEAMKTIESLARWLNLILLVVAAGAILASLLTMLSISTSLQSGVM